MIPGFSREECSGLSIGHSLYSLLGTVTLGVLSLMVGGVAGLFTGCAGLGLEVPFGSCARLVQDLVGYSYPWLDAGHCVYTHATPAVVHSLSIRGTHFMFTFLLVSW